MTSIFAIVVIGFAFLSVAHLSRYWLIRQSGYMLFFATVTAGCTVAASAMLMVEAIWPVNEGIERMNFDIFESVNVINLSTAGTASILLGLLVNLIVSRDRAARLVSFLCGDLVEVLLQRAMDKRTTVDLTLSNGKSYIGYPVDSGITTFHESDIAILLTLSGFRASETKDLVITTSYFEFLRDARNRSREIEADDFVVIIPKEQIVSAKNFNFETYRRFVEIRQAHNS